MVDAGDAALPLLETKLHVPRRRPEVVGRPRLVERFAAAGPPPLTLVSAPAGFGKTTLVVDWLHELPAGTTTAWVSLDQRDDDPARFWAYVTAALQAAEPPPEIEPGEPGDAGDAGRSAFEAGAPIGATVTTLANELARLDHPVVLVLDDLHSTTNPAVHESLLPLLEHLPHQLHVVVTTRSDPPWPLGAWRARGGLLEVRAADLRFRDDETAAYVNGAMGLDLAPEQVRLLDERTEGWAAALQLAALSLQGHEDTAAFLEAFAGDHRYVVDYLVGEVLERQDEATRSFLLQTAILRTLTGPLCDAVTAGTLPGQTTTGEEAGRATLERLDRSNLFVVPLDSRRQQYRYHHLFAEVLRSRLLDEQPDLVPTLHRRAVEWHAEHGELAEAVHHALAAGDAERAADLVELAVPSLRRARQEATLRSWYAQLPEASLAERPVLAIGLVGVRMAGGEPDGVPDLLDGIERWLAEDEAGADDRAPGEGASAGIVVDRDELRRLPHQVATYRAALALMAGDLATTEAHARRALATAADDDHLTHGSNRALLALTRWSAGDLADAEREYGEAIAQLGRAGHHSDVLGCSLALADVQVGQGRLHDALATLAAGLDLATEHPELRGGADMHVGTAEVLIEQGELDRAKAHLDLAQQLGPEVALPQNAHRTDVAQARLCLADGDLDQALALLDEAERRYQGDFSPDVRPIAALRARVLLARGELDAARRWAAGRGLGPDDELTYLREAEHLTLARVLLAEAATTSSPGTPHAADTAESLDTALALLDRLLAAAEEGGRAGSMVEALALRALAEAQRGDDVRAVAALDEALARARPEGFVRTFLDEGPPVLELLEQVAARGEQATAARGLLAEARAAPGPPPAPTSSPGRGGQDELVEPLSQRELDVLRLLRSELSGPEIAGELLVSLNTMRTHTKSIYLKLGVNSRRAAVRRADELGL